MSKNQDTNTPGQVGKQPGTTSTDALDRMDELIKRRDEIDERIADIKSEYGVVISKQHRLQTAIFGLNDRLRGMPENDQRYAATRQEIAAELEQVRMDFAQNEDHQKKLDVEIKQLQTIDLPACVVAVYAEDVMAHQQRVEQAALVVNNIQVAIDSQNQSIAEAKAKIPQRTNRQQERHNLLAEIALGNASDGDLKKMDAAIEKEQKTVTDAENGVAPLIEQGQATVSGLARKLAASKEVLQALEFKSDEVAFRYFMGEAEKAAVEYVNHAMRLKELHIRLTGLDVFIQKHDLHGIVQRGAKQLHIPMFRLPQFEGLGDPGTVSLIDGYKMMTDHPAEQAAEIEKHRLDAIRSGHFYQ